MVKQLKARKEFVVAVSRSVGDQLVKDAGAQPLPLGKLDPKAALVVTFAEPKARNKAKEVEVLAKKVQYCLPVRHLP